MSALQQKSHVGFREKFIGDKAFYALILSVAIPIMIQNGITSFVNMLDNIMVGRIGTEQMSGVSIVNQLYMVYMLTMFGGVGGVGIFTAQYFGNRDMEGIRHTFRYKFWLSLIVTVAAFVVLKCFQTPLIELFLSDSSDGGDLTATLHYGEDYLNILFLMFPAFALLQVYSSTLRECGMTKVPMAAGVAAVLVNLVLNFVLIFGYLGFPELGVRGAALATVISRYVEAGICMIWTHRHKNQCAYIKGIYKSLTVPMGLTKRYFLKGVPLMINELMWAGGLSVLMQCYSVRGLNAIVAYNISSTLNNIVNIVIAAMGNAVAIIVGQKLGAGLLDEAKDVDNKIIFTSVGLSVFTGLILAAMSGFFPGFYNTSDAAKKLASGIILVQAVYQPIHAFYITSYFTLRAGGKTVITFLFDSCFMWVVNLPIAFVLSRFTGLSVIAMLICSNAADLIKCLVGYILIRKNVWLNNIVKQG